MPTEYTDYLGETLPLYSQHSRAKRHQNEIPVDIESSEETMDIIENQIEIFDKFSNISTTARRATTTESPQDQDYVEALDTDEKLQELIDYIRNRRMDQDPKIQRLLSSLGINGTLDKPKTVLNLVMHLIDRSQQKEEENEVPVDDECLDLEEYRILPDDNPETVRWKQAKKMRCYMDESVDPCEKFYSYACGRWAKHHPIPKDRVGYDIFEILRGEVDEKLIEMLTEPPNDQDNNATTAAKLLYSSCMNEGTIA